MWNRIRKFFLDSEVIFLARLQMLGGATIEALAAAQPEIIIEFIPNNWVGLYLLGAGIVIEFARRLRDEDLTKKGR